MMNCFSMMKYHNISAIFIYLYWISMIPIPTWVKSLDISINKAEFSQQFFMHQLYLKKFKAETCYIHQFDRFNNFHENSGTFWRISWELTMYSNVCLVFKIQILYKINCLWKIFSRNRTFWPHTQHMIRQR